jgi:hypothetical protein
MDLLEMNIREIKFNNLLIESVSANKSSLNVLGVMAFTQTGL